METTSITKQIPTYIVDAFTVGNNEPFTGNPAAICILEYDDDITDEEKQKVAQEMNAPVTAFVSRQGWSRNKLQTNSLPIRWFTVSCELNVCGHGTLAASKVLFNDIQTPKSKNGDDEIKFESKKAGSLGATICWATGIITLDLPLNPNPSLPLTQEKPWAQHLITSTLGPEINSDLIMDVQISKTLKNVSIHLHEGEDLSANEAIIKKVKPNWSEMLKVVTGGESIDSVLVSIKGEATIAGPHYFARAFYPWIGIQEDAATGSAQTILAPYWKEHLEKKQKLCLKQIHVRQMSSRGGQLIANLEGKRMKLGGNARLVFAGAFFHAFIKTVCKR